MNSIILYFFRCENKSHVADVFWYGAVKSFNLTCVGNNTWRMTVERPGVDEKEADKYHVS